MHGLAVLGLVIIIFILILNRHVSGLTSSTSQCANCPTKPPGTYYTVVNGCTTGACITCPAVQNGINLLTTPCVDATDTAPSGTPGACTLTCNTGYSKSTDGLSCVPDCVGAWGALCSTTCGPGVFTYKVQTPAGPGGKACKDVDGTVLNDLDTKPCANPDCGTPCEGTWSNYGLCSDSCGYAKKTRKFTGTTQARNGGAACESKYGSNAHWPESYETTTCTDLPACVAGLPCVGEWSDWGGCSAPCDGGIKKKTYNVKRAATVGTDGTRGAACPYADGEQQQEACNTQTCCSEAIFGDWQKYGSVSCSGNSSGKPEQNWARNIRFPPGTPVNTTTKSCSMEQFYTKYTGTGCPDVTPSTGTCSISGVTWNATDGCKLPWSATKQPTGGTCSNPEATYSRTASPSDNCTMPVKLPLSGKCSETTLPWSSSTGCNKPSIYDVPCPNNQCFVDKLPSAACPTGYYQVYGSSTTCMYLVDAWNKDHSNYCTPGYSVRSSASRESRALNRTGYYCYFTGTHPTITSLVCPPGYVGDITTNTCKAIPVSISTLDCDTNYTADKVNNTCRANPVSITGLTCPEPYFSENRTINKCSATTTGDEAPKKTATGN